MEDLLISAARKSLTSKDARSSNFIGMVECRRDELDIRVTTANIDRALRFMDALIKSLKARGYEIHFKNNETYAIVKGDDIKIKFHELSKRVTMTDRNWNRTEMHPTGILCFKAGNFSPREWKDSKSDPERKVENFLPDIIAWLEQEADKWNAIRDEHRREREIQEKKQQAEREELESKKNEFALFEKLLDESQRWYNSKLLKEFIDEKERQGADIDWVMWARRKLDWFDPFVEEKDSLLGKYIDN